MVKAIIPNNQKINYIALVLDKSGSMKLIRESIIEAFNANIKTLKLETGDMVTKVCLIPFSSSKVIKPTLWCSDLDNVEELTYSNYVPVGGTPMYDAIGYTIDKLQQETSESTDDISFLVTIISDGEENASKTYTGKQISEMVKECEADGRWTITYIGANQDLTKVSKDIGVDNMMQFDSTKVGTQVMGASYSLGTSKYFDGRRKGFTKVSNLYDGSSVVDDDGN